jgi:hypothetical protein
MSYSILDGSNNLSIKNFYEVIDNYFESPILEKIQNSENKSIYMAKIKTLLASPEQRYIIAITDLDLYKIGKKLPLNNISWKSFQTRCLANLDKNIVTHSYSSKNIPEYTLKLSLMNRYEDHTDYSLDEYNSLTITLVHKNKNLYEYPSSGNLASCLETYKSVIVING